MLPGPITCTVPPLKLPPWLPLLVLAVGVTTIVMVAVDPDCRDIGPQLTAPPSAGRSAIGASAGTEAGRIKRERHNRCRGAQIVGDRDSAGQVGPVVRQRVNESRLSTSADIGIRSCREHPLNRQIHRRS